MGFGAAGLETLGKVGNCVISAGGAQSALGSRARGGLQPHRTSTKTCCSLHKHPLLIIVGQS